MVRFRTRARLIALTAAYALALQGLLSAFAVPAIGAAVPLTALCSVMIGEADGALPVAPGPGAHDCGACVVGGCAGGVCMARETAAKTLGPSRSAAAQAAVPLRSALAAIRTPQNPRAPPLS